MILINFLMHCRSISSTSHEGDIGEGVLSCAFSPTGNSVVTTSQNGAVRVSLKVLYYMEARNTN